MKDYKVYYYENLKAVSKELKLIKRGKGWNKPKNHPLMRRVYVRNDIERKNLIYYKIWGNNYIYMNSFQRALSLGFYESAEFSPLIGIIFNKEQVCRGYVMKHTDECSINIKIRSFLSLNKPRMGYRLIDMAVDDVRMYGNKPCIIDIEKVMPEEEYPISKHYLLLLISKWVTIKLIS